MNAKLRKYNQASWLIVQPSWLPVFCVLSMLLEGQVFAQCGDIQIENKNGSATRGKVGTMCGTSCPDYYLTSSTITKHYFVAVVSGDCGIEDSETYDFSETDTTTIDPTRKTDGTPMVDGCPAPSAWQANTCVGTVSDIGVTSAGCGYAGNTFNGSGSLTNCVSGWTGSVTYTSDGGSPYTEPGAPVGQTAGGYPFPDTATSTTTIDPNLCTDTKTETDYSCVDGYFTFTGYDSTEVILSSPYSTGTIEGIVDGLSTSRRDAASFVTGDASNSRHLEPNESCATESAAKYRFKIDGTNPKQTYTITWQVNTNNVVGSVTTVNQNGFIKKTGIQGQPGIWYYPSSDGEDVVPTPIWPPGCTTGGTYTITYFSPTITPDAQAPAPNPQ